MRIILALVLLAALGLFFAPTGVPLGVFSNADLSKAPPALLAAARYDRLSNTAVSLAIREYVESSGPGMPQPETLITLIRGRVLSGKDQMAVFALERADITREIHGWEMAASECFAKSAQDLTLADAATLLAHMRSPSKNWDNHEGELLERRNTFLEGMAENGYVTVENAAEAALSPLAYCGKR